MIVRRALEAYPMFLTDGNPNPSLRGVGGIFDSIKDAVGDVLEGARDVVKGVVTLKYLHKGLGWAWGHMGEDMRKLVMQIGPMVANAYLPGSGALAKMALQVLEVERVSKKQKKKAKKEIKAYLEGEVAAGRLAPGLIDPNNTDHLEALVLALNMPPDVKAQWFRQNGMAPEPAAADVHAHAAAAAPRAAAAAGLLALAAVL